MTLEESKINPKLLYFHGTANKIERLKVPSANKPFFVCGDIDYAYSYAYAGQVNGRTNFSIKQKKPGFVYVIELNPQKINIFDALNNNDISRLSKLYPKYVIDSLKEKKWSIWSIFSYINDYLYYYYIKNFKNVKQFENYLTNRNFNDYFDNKLFFQGISDLTERYENEYKKIYSSKDKWDCLFNIISLFNNQLESLGYNAFLNRENVSKVKESELDDKVMTQLAIGLFDKECLKSGYPYALPIDNVKNAVDKFQSSKDYIETKNLIQSFTKKYEEREKVNEANKIDFDKYEIIELTGSDLEAILPYLRPLIKKSYEKIGGKQGDRTVEQLKAVQTMAQVVYDKGKIIAYALAKKVHADDVGNKLNLIGCDQTWKGKEAMQAIIKYNIDNFNRKVWCECSGAIEHWFKKYDGYPISNQLVPEIIGEPRDKVWFHEDGYHYRRFLPAAHNRFVQKIMFGFVNDEVMQKTLNSIGYDIMRDKINNKIHEGDQTSFEKATQFVLELQKNVKDGTIDAMLPSMEEYLDKAIEILANGRSALSIEGRKIKEQLKPLKTGEIKNG